MKKFRYWPVILMLVLLITGFCIPSFAADDEPRVLKVAFSQLKGFSETAPDGRRYGLIVDYLNEISKYTGWEYEYVDTLSDSAINEFIAGKYDLMGGNYYFPGLEKYFAYPDYNIGHSKSILMARRDDISMRSSDLRSLNGKTIGVYDRAAENVHRLEVFLEANSLDCTLKYYTYEQLSSEGNLFQYLKNGEVDMLLGNNYEEGNPFRVVASFDSQPFYIVAQVGDQEILDGLNMALSKIMESDPTFDEQRYAANFPDITIDIELNENEKAYVRQKKVVKVAVPESFHPLFYEELSGKQNTGLTGDILAEVSAYCGLDFSYVYADSYIEAVGLVKQGEADLLGFFLGTNEDSIEQNLALTAPYVNLNSIVVRNKASSFPGKGLVGAVLEGRVMPNEIETAKVCSYASMEEALRAVNRGEADFIYGQASSLEHEIQLQHFTNLIPVTLVNDRSDISFAMVRPADSDLLTILNKAINQLSSEKKNEILDRNMVSIGTGSLSLKEIIYANPIMFIVIVTAVLLALVAFVLGMNRVRMHAAVMKNNLEKAEAESRAKGEFLSRMSHEIRTPINAVIGLADLTTMKGELPAETRDNLMKLRSSAHYLLDLINDILDMSRIDGGLLTIASEPFSLESMLKGIQAMMETEAKRRGLTYGLEQNITHGDLVGDTIRLRQVLTNLLSNAFKFTPQNGTVLLKVDEISCSLDGATYSFRVIDSGMGIAPEDQERIFQTFEQLGTNYSKSQGTGLGLPISHSIVQQMGGDLCVNSELGCGSEFYFTISMPLGKPSNADETHIENFADRPNSLDGIQILLAEDNDLNAEIVIQLLELQGAAVHRAENGRKAVEYYSSSKPGEIKVILMDIQMPEMNGLEAANAIRKLARPDAATVPIVAMTANTFKEDVDAAMEAGMNGFIPKPLDIEYLYHFLQDIIKDANPNSDKLT